MTTLIRQIANMLRPIMGLSVLAIVIGLGGCGGGGTGGTGVSSQTPGVAALAVSPGTVTIDSGVAVPFTVSGGTPPYQITSSNLPVIPVNSLVSQNGSFSITANSVLADTTLTLTVRDSGGQNTVATVTVKAAKLTVTPADVTVDSGVATTFVVTGGTGPYSVVSSNLPVIPLNGATSQTGSFSITPNSVATDTAVTLTFTDATHHTATATVTVRAPVLSVSPATVTINSGVATTFVVTGGTGPYSVVSDNLPVIALDGFVSQNGTFSITANSVSVDTPVTLTFRDAGGHTVSSKVTVKATAPLVVLPSTATVYSGIPAIITASGGTPPYIMISTNPAVIPSQTTPSTSGNFLIQVPNVSVITPVVLVFRDAQGQTATATITVNPALPAEPTLKTLTITPTPAAPGVGCGTAVCSGGDASVSVVLLSALGAPMPNRKVRFDVPSGSDYTIQTGNVAQTSVNTLTVSSDQTGTANIRILVKTTAPTQVAFITATDTTSGNFVTASFTIAQFTDGTSILSVLPTDASIGGPDSVSCSDGVETTYYIFGGTPPYRVVAGFPGTVAIVGAPVTTNGGGFTARTTGICLDPLNLIITDATGRTVTATLHNKLGTGAPEAPSPPLLEAVPPSITISPLCGANGTVTGTGETIIIGGSGANVVSSSDPNRMTATVGGSPSLLTVTLTNNPPVGSTFTATVFDGTRFVQVPVTVGPCTGPPVIGPIALSTSSVIMSCGETGTFGITGGTGVYSLSGITPPGYDAAVNGQMLTVTKLGTFGSDNSLAGFVEIFVTDTAGGTAKLTITGTGSPANCGIKPSTVVLSCGSTQAYTIGAGGTAPYSLVSATPSGTGFTFAPVLPISGTSFTVTKGSGANNTSVIFVLKDNAGHIADFKITGSGSPATCP